MIKRFRRGNTAGAKNETEPAKSRNSSRLELILKHRQKAFADPLIKGRLFQKQILLGPPTDDQVQDSNSSRNTNSNLSRRFLVEDLKRSNRRSIKLFN